MPIFHKEHAKLNTPCDQMMLKAKEASWQGNDEFAILLYQTLIEEQYPFVKFFSHLKEQQKDRVLFLAAAHNMVYRVQALMDAGKKIHVLCQCVYALRSCTLPLAVEKK